ncbi:uncharacterized protein [Macrobrachium rosenbergii]|uniref:uncharacterized protein isoform X2 n=1 Tax=Macrobrachium rosenbergii TaxID=79674 RepID=UPI0034D4FDAC
MYFAFVVSIPTVASQKQALPPLGRQLCPAANLCQDGPLPFTVERASSAQIYFVVLELTGNYCKKENHHEKSSECSQLTLGMKFEHKTVCSVTWMMTSTNLGIFWRGA